MATEVTHDGTEDTHTWAILDVNALYLIYLGDFKTIALQKLFAMHRLFNGIVCAIADAR